MQGAAILPKIRIGKGTVDEKAASVAGEVSQLHLGFVATEKAKNDGDQAHFRNERIHQERDIRERLESLGN
mgnify:FL=1